MASEMDGSKSDDIDRRGMCSKKIDISVVAKSPAFDGRAEKNNGLHD